MLNPVFALALVFASADTAPVVPAGASVATTGSVVLAGAPAAAPASRARALSPLASAMSKPKLFSADSIVLDKSDRRLTFYQNGQLVRAYEVALGKNPVGAKQRRGDGKTPEGLYFIEGRNPESKYHLALRISYPATKDLAIAARRGVSPGGDIMIHGLPKPFAAVGALHRQQDWTEGCIAVTNDEIEEIWRAVPNGARILIKP
jgi:murein L,D-transpeptidase YafK